MWFKWDVGSVWLPWFFCGHQAADWKLADHPETKNPAGFAGEQGSRNSVTYGRIVELPAGLLDEVFACLVARDIRGGGPRIGCLQAEPESGLANAQEHTRATQPRGRLRMYWICFD